MISNHNNKNPLQLMSKHREMDLGSLNFHFLSFQQASYEQDLETSIRGVECSGVNKVSDCGKTSTKLEAINGEGAL